MELLLNNYGDVFTQHILSYLTLNDLNLFSRVNHLTHNMIFNQEHNSYLFQQLYLNQLAIANNSEAEQQVLQQYQSSKLTWMEFYKQNALLKFDVEFTKDTQKFIKFKNNNRTIDIGKDEAYTWDSVTCNYKMVPGGIYRWKFIVEKYEKTSNTFELVMGCVQRNALDVDGQRFNSRLFIVDLKDYNGGIGFNTGVWVNRLGTEQSSDNVLIEKVDDLDLCVPFTVGFELNFVSSSFAELEIYWNGELLSTIQKSDPPSEYYPVISSCFQKVISVRGW
jgi:hypothetical protein